MKLIQGLSVLLLLTSGMLNAASLGTYRVYLDNDNRTQKFPVKNRSNIPEQCHLAFKYRAYEGKGLSAVKQLDAAQQKQHSKQALERIRYSPRSFVVKPRSTQNIAFSLRRRVGDTAQEFRTYAVINCKKVNNSASTGQVFVPVLEHMVPVVIRTGRVNELSANLNLVQTNDNKRIRLELNGDRSVYGDINVVDESNQIIQVVEKNAVIYPDMKYREVNLPNFNVNLEKLKLQFVETGKFSNKQTYYFEL